MFDGWILLHRILLNKPIWKNSTPEQKTILITLLLMASHSENEWDWKGNKFKIKPGQFITSLYSIKERCGKGIEIQNIRTALKRFKKLEFLTEETTNTGRLITICNWESYQHIKSLSNKATNKQLTSNQQATNKQLTTIKECNNENNENNEILKGEYHIEDKEQIFKDFHNEKYQKYKKEAFEIVEYLNKLCNMNFGHQREIINPIIKILQEGASIDECKKVIDNCKDNKFLKEKRLLKPSFIFKLENFQSYLSDGDTLNIDMEETINKIRKEDK